MSQSDVDFLFDNFQSHFLVKYEKPHSQVPPKGVFKSLLFLFESIAMQEKRKSKLVRGSVSPGSHEKTFESSIKRQGRSFTITTSSPQQKEEMNEEKAKKCYDEEIKQQNARKLLSKTKIRSSCYYQNINELTNPLYPVIRSISTTRGKDLLDLFQDDATESSHSSALDFQESSYPQQQQLTEAAQNSFLPQLVECQGERPSNFSKKYNFEHSYQQELIAKDYYNDNFNLNECSFSNCGNSFSSKPIHTSKLERIPSGQSNQHSSDLRQKMNGTKNSNRSRLPFTNQEGNISNLNVSNNANNQDVSSNQIFKEGVKQNRKILMSISPNNQSCRLNQKRAYEIKAENENENNIQISNRANLNQTFQKDNNNNLKTNFQQITTQQYKGLIRRLGLNKIPLGNLRMVQVVPQQKMPK